MIRDLVEKNRSYRRFRQDHRVEKTTLEELVGLARLGASGANLQPLKFLLSTDPERNSLIFKTLSWAGYLKEWPGPGEGERPSAYIIILGDRDITEQFSCDHGIAAQSILLGAVEKGLGGCMLSNIDAGLLKQNLGLGERYEVLLAVALGVPVETVVVEELAPGGDVRYWRDAEGVHHVPKRTLEEIIVEPGGE